MFKARGTKIVFDDEIEQSVPVPAPEPAAPVRLEPPAVSRLTPLATPTAESGLSRGDEIEVQEQPDDETEDLAAAMGMGLPTLPPNFRDKLLAAQAGDLEAIALMRAIGDQVPAHLQMTFMEMVHDMLAEH